MTESKAHGRKVTVIGAGFSGLATAVYLVKAGFQVRVVDRCGQAGGLIGTQSTASGPVETAANGLLNSPDVEDLFSEVGAPMIGVSKTATRRYVWRNGVARKWPVGFFATIRVLKFVFRFTFNRSHVAPRPGQSIWDWSVRHLGSENARHLVEPGIQGIHPAPIERLSASLVLGRFFKSKKRHFRPVKIRGTVCCPNGMGELIDRMQTYLVNQGARVELNSLGDLNVSRTEPVVLATSVREAAILLKPIDSVRSNLLNRVQTIPMVSVTATFASTDPKSRGFGILFPPVEKHRMLGILKNNFIFSNRTYQGFSETWMLGLEANRDLLTKSDSQIQDLIEGERKRCFGLSDKAQSLSVNRWPNALPLYDLELEKVLQELKAYDQNIFLVGNYLGDIGLSRIVERAKEIPDLISTQGRWT